MLPQSSKPTPGLTQTDNFAFYLWCTTEQLSYQIIGQHPLVPKRRVEAFMFLSKLVSMAAGMFGNVLDMNSIQTRYDAFINYEFTSLPEFEAADSTKVLTLCDFFVRDRKKFYHTELYNCFNPHGPRNLPYKSAYLLFVSPLRESDSIPENLEFLYDDAQKLQKNLDTLFQGLLENIHLRVKTLNFV